jgi:uncharacterized protein involved in response to NO
VIVETMAAIPRYRPHAGPILLSAGFRPFFLGAAIWAAIGIPLWLAAYGGGTSLTSLLPPPIWHVHEMVFGFAAATVAGFLLTAIPNWTGRLPLQGRPLAVLVSLWTVGRAGVLLSGLIGGYAAAVADLAFPAAFLGAVAREIVAGKNWRNLPMLAALSLLLIGNLLVHLDALGIADTADFGNRIGIATLLMLISLVGGRIIPSFTRNWLAKNRPDVSPPRPEGHVDHAVLGVTALVLVAWTIAPDAVVTAWGTIIAGSAIGLRMARWQGHETVREPLLLILHVGYAWLAIGLVLIGLDELLDVVPTTAALHALTVGAIGTMTLAVMTRASLGHTGRPLVAGPGTQAIYVLVTLAALLRVLSPFAGLQMTHMLWAAGASWTAAFGSFAILYGRVLARPRVTGRGARPI